MARDLRRKNIFPSFVPRTSLFLIVSVSLCPRVTVPLSRYVLMLPLLLFDPLCAEWHRATVPMVSLCSCTQYVSVSVYLAVACVGVPVSFIARYLLTSVPVSVQCPHVLGKT